MRWPHPERGMIPPFKFIPLAEEILSIRTRLQGSDNCATMNSSKKVEFLKDIAKLPPEAQAEITEAAQQIDDAALLTRQGKYAESELLYGSAIETYGSLLGKDHDEVLKRLKELAWVHLRKCEPGEAEKLYRKSLKNMD